MKLKKAEVKFQRELLDLINSDKVLTEDEIENIYENFNPAIIDNLTERGVYFTPLGLAQDLAVFAPKDGNVVDVCAGIGTLTYRMQQMDYYNKKNTSCTCIEINPEFVRIGKRLLPNVNWICADIFDKSLWDSLPKFDLMVSNPPFGKGFKDKSKIEWFNYKGDIDLMVVELCLKFVGRGYFILPQMSCSFRYSGRPYYEEIENRKINTFKKANKDLELYMHCDGIDTSIYKDDWKNVSPSVEVAYITKDNEY